MSAAPRRAYLDWLRGVAVLIMIEAHTLDSWTRLEDRGRTLYGWAMLVAGFAAPVFLFLAGIALALAAAGRVNRGASPAEAAALARRRGWQILGLAFLFRLQSWLISRGPAISLLKVDILNVMGLGMVAAATLWGLGRTQWARAVLLAAATAAVAMLTPIVRVTDILTPLPDPLEWYFRPVPGRTTFTLFPWAGFLIAGAAAGLWIQRTSTAEQERSVVAALGAVGVVTAVAGYAASFLPAIYQETSFWTSSPTFFFLRLGIVLALIPLAYAWNRVATGPSPLRTLGLSSLFVYWIHVEIVYGVLTLWLHKRLPLEASVAAFAGFTALMYWLVKVKERYSRRPEGLRLPQLEFLRR